MIEKDISAILDEKNQEELMELIIDTFEKQVPYKPKAYPGYEGQCKCGAVFLDKSTKYCGNCGQKLDWEE